MRVETENTIQIEDLVWYVDDYCYNDCYNKTCYFKAWTRIIDEGKRQSFYDVIYNKPTLIVPENLTLIINHVGDREKERLIEARRVFFEATALNSKITLVSREVKDIWDFKKQIGELWDWNRISCVQVSRIKRLNDIDVLRARAPKTKIVNLLDTYEKPSPVRLKIIERAGVDLVYLILHKNPLGRKQDISHYRSYLRARALIEQLDVTWADDRCVIDSIKHLRDPKHRCGAGINRLTAWPGHTSGCPYDSLKHITPSSSKHCMEYCGISEMIGEFNGNLKDY